MLDGRIILVLQEFFRERRKNCKYIIEYLNKMKKYSSSMEEKMNLVSAKAISLRNTDNNAYDHCKSIQIC